MEPDAKQTLLQLPVRGEPRRIDDAIDPAVDHDRDAFRDGRRHPDVLLDQEHGHVAVLAEARQHVFDLGDNHRRQPFGRFIHDQKMRIGEQRAGDREHLLLAAGQLAAAIVLALGKAGKGLIDALDSPRPTAYPGGQPQMLVDAERAPQSPPLRNVADTKPRDARRIDTGDIFTTNAHRPAA